MTPPTAPSGISPRRPPATGAAVTWPMFALLTLAAGLLLGTGTLRSTADVPQTRPSSAAHQLPGTGAEISAAAQATATQTTVAQARTVTERAHVLATSADVGLGAVLLLVATITVALAQPMHRRRHLQPHRRGPPDFAFTD